MEQFCLLAQSQKGRACAALIEQALNHKRLFQYQSLLNISSVLSLKDSEYAKVYNTLVLFCSGTADDYFGNRENYLDLSDAQLFKLRQLSLLLIAQTQKLLSYEFLYQHLRITNYRDLEDIIIESIIGNLLTAKIDQANSIVHIYSSSGRDNVAYDTSDLIFQFERWLRNTTASAESYNTFAGSLQSFEAKDMRDNESLIKLWEEKKKTLKEQLEGIDIQEPTKAKLINLNKF